MTRWLPFEGHLLCPTDRPAQPASPQTPPESPIDAPRFGHLAEIPRETWANRSRAKTASIFRFSRQPIQWLSSDTTNHWIISSDYPVIIQWLSSDYHSWSSDTTQLWSTGRPPKKTAPFSTVFLWPRLSQLASTAALQWPKPHVTEFLGSQALGVGKPGVLFNVATLWAPVISWFISPSNYSYKYHKP